MQKRIPAVLMRGGTSKGLFFHEKDLPPEPRLRDQAILAAYGSPDPYRRQIDGVGGALSVTSKVAVISPSPSPDYDVVYHFGQVSIDRPIVDGQGQLRQHLLGRRPVCGGRRLGESRRTRHPGAHPPEEHEQAHRRRSSGQGR